MWSHANGHLISQYAPTNNLGVFNRAEKKWENLSTDFLEFTAVNNYFHIKEDNSLGFFLCIVSASFYHASDRKHGRKHLQDKTPMFSWKDYQAMSPVLMPFWSQQTQGLCTSNTWQMLHLVPCMPLPSCYLYLWGRSELKFLPVC